MSRQRLIAYRRVSTARQGVSGLGLEASTDPAAGDGDPRPVRRHLGWPRSANSASTAVGPAPP